MARVENKIQQAKTYNIAVYQSVDVRIFLRVLQFQLTNLDNLPTDADTQFYQKIYDIKEELTIQIKKLNNEFEELQTARKLQQQTAQ